MLCQRESKSTYELQQEGRRKSLKLYEYRGHKIPVLGSTIINCKMKEIRRKTKFYVVNAKGKTIKELNSYEEM